MCTDCAFFSTFLHKYGKIFRRAYIFFRELWSTKIRRFVNYEAVLRKQFYRQIG